MVVVVFDCFTNIRRGFLIHKKNLIYFLIKQGGVHTPTILQTAALYPLIIMKYVRAKVQQKYETKK
jgi:hypothetical protein